MAIVPVYRLTATSANPASRNRYARYRFSRDPLPNRNPNPGEPDPDGSSRWTIDRVAFYAWNGPSPDAESSVPAAGRAAGAAMRIEPALDALVPVYEFYRVDADAKLVAYRYATETEPGEGWIRMEPIAFWLYPEAAEGTGVPIYVYRHDISNGKKNYALAVTKDRPDPKQAPEPWTNEWTNESPDSRYGKDILGRASTTLPVEVSARRSNGAQGGFDCTYTPSTIRVPYPSTIEFRPAPGSEYAIKEVAIDDKGDNFDPVEKRRGRVRVATKYRTCGCDFSYRLKLDTPGGESDPAVTHETQERL